MQAHEKSAPIKPVAAATSTNSDADSSVVPSAADGAATRMSALESRVFELEAVARVKRHVVAGRVFRCHRRARIGNGIDGIFSRVVSSLDSASPVSPPFFMNTRLLFLC